MPARGRPRGPRKVLFALRLRPELKDCLKALSLILEGRPPINGIIELAIERYVGEKLQDPDLREAIDRVIGERALRLVRRASHGDS